MKEMNPALGHFCTHTGLIGPREPPEDDAGFEIQTLEV